MRDPRAFRSFAMVLFALMIHAGILGARPVLAAGGAVKLTSCTTISKAGTYILGVNINRTGDCFKIQADLVILDLDGLSLTGKGSGAGITANGNNVQGVVIRNGMITNFAEGINLSNASSAQIEDMVLTKQSGKNIQVGSASTVKDTTMTGGTDGIVAGDGCALHANNITDVSNDGIRVGAGSTVTGNTVSFAGGDGLQVDCPSTVVQNTSTGSGSNDLLLNGAGCTAADNTAPVVP